MQPTHRRAFAGCCAPRVPSDRGTDGPGGRSREALALAVRFFGSPLSLNAEELLELRLAADELRHGGLEGRARIVETLALKLRDLVPSRLLARIDPDLEALLAAEGLASRPGPRPAVRHEILAAIRRAITAGQAVRILYRARDPVRGRRAAAPLWRRVEPLGVLYGTRHYLGAVAV